MSLHCIGKPSLHTYSTDSLSAPLSFALHRSFGTVCVMSIWHCFLTSSSSSANACSSLLTTFTHIFHGSSPFLWYTLTASYCKLQISELPCYMLNVLFNALYSNSYFVSWGVAVKIITHRSWPFRYSLVQVIPTKTGMHVREQADDLYNWQAEAQEIL